MDKLDKLKKAELRIALRKVSERLTLAETALEWAEENGSTEQMIRAAQWEIQEAKEVIKGLNS